MYKLVITFLVFAFIFSSIKTEDELTVCNKYPNPVNYKSKVNFRYKNKVYHIEEYFIENRGKLVVSIGKKTIEHYFQRDETTKQFHVATYDRKNNHCTLKTFKDKEIILHADRPYGFYNPKSGIFGPTGLWSMIDDHKKGFKKDEKPSTIPREILTDVCKTEIENLEGIPGKSKIELFLADSTWNVFDQANPDVPQVVKIIIDSPHKLPDEKEDQFFKAELEYLTYEVLSYDNSDDKKLHEFGDEAEDFWFSPSSCPGLTSQIPEAVQIPNKLKMVVEEIDELKLDQKKPEEDEKDKTETNPLRKKIYLDQEHNVQRIDSENDFTSIYETKNSQEFVMNKEECITYYNKEPENYQLLNIINELKSKDDRKNYNMVGNKIIRNILTEVYRKKEEDVKDGKVTHIIKTIYLQKNADGYTYNPIWIRYEELVRKDSEDEDNVSKRKVSLLYDIFDFENIEKTDDLVEAFNVAECVDKEFLEEFNIVAREKKAEQGELEDDNDDDNNDDDNNDDDNNDLDLSVFRNDLRKKLVEIASVSVLNFPKIDVERNAKEFIATIRFINTVNPKAFFIEPKEKIPVKKEGKNEKHNVASMSKCAEKALENKDIIGYQYCDLKEEIYCGMIKKDDKFVVHDNEKCKIQVKHENAEKIEYETFEKKMKKIEEKVKSDKFDLFTGGTPIVAKRLHRIKEESQIDRSKLFEVSLKGKKFNEKQTKKQLQLEDGISSLLNCYEACTNPLNSFSCDSFSFCQKFDKTLFDCHLGNLITDGKTKPKESDYFEDDEDCNTYTVSSLKHFEEHSNRKLIAEDKDNTIINIYDETNSNECAQLCINKNFDTDKNNNKKCSSIELCEENNKPRCRLTVTETLVNENALKKDDNCKVYSIKHLLNFHATTKTKLEDFIEKNVETVDQCATICDISGDCDRFNYCESKDSTQSKCRYLSKSSGDEKKRTEYDSDELGCVSYVHRNKLIGAPKNGRALIDEKKILKNNGVGYKGASLTKFIFLSLFIGLLIGSIGLYVMKFYGKKESSGGGDNVAINFSNLKDDF